MERTGSSSKKNMAIAAGILGVLALGVVGIFASDFYEVDDDDGLVAEMDATDAARMGVEPVDRMVVDPEVEVGSMATVTDAQLIQIASLSGTDAAMFTGRPVRLSGLKVTSVVGDKTFFVRPEGTDIEPVLVYLVEVPTPGTEIEGRYDVDPGDGLALMGTVESMAGMDMDALGLTNAEQMPAKNDGVYLRATTLRME